MRNSWANAGAIEPSARTDDAARATVLETFMIDPRKAHEGQHPVFGLPAVLNVGVNANTTRHPQNYREDVRHTELLARADFRKAPPAFSRFRRVGSSRAIARLCVNLPRAVRSQIIFAYFGPDLSDCGRLPRFSFGGGVWALGEQSA